MKQTLSLSITNPCTEKWDQFAPTPEGGFCSVCQKNVIDFTTLSDAEVIDFFKNKPAYTCGKFRPNQLRTYALPIKSFTKPQRNLLQVGMLGMLALFSSHQGYSQHLSENTGLSMEQLPIGKPTALSDQPARIVTGTVTDENKEPLPGVNVNLKGTSVGTTTDANGNFKFPQELKAGDVLIFSFIGFITDEYVIPKEIPSSLKTTLITLEADIMGAVAVESPYAEQPTGIAKWWQKVKSIF